MKALRSLEPLARRRRMPKVEQIRGCDHQGGDVLQIHVTGRHVEVTDEVREYVHAKAGRLPRFYDRIHEIEVVLDHDSDLFTAEMIVRAGGKHTFVATESGPDTMALIDTVTDRLERQLTKLKERNRNHKHDGKAELGE